MMVDKMLLVDLEVVELEVIGLVLQLFLMLQDTL